MSTDYKSLDGSYVAKTRLFSFGRKGTEIAEIIESLSRDFHESDIDFYPAVPDSGITLPRSSFNAGNIRNLLHDVDLVLLVGEMNDPACVDAALRVVREARAEHLLSLGFVLQSETKAGFTGNIDLSAVLKEVGAWIVLDPDEPHALQTLMTGIKAILAALYARGLAIVDLSDS